jgi:hypothetical protein
MRDHTPPIGRRLGAVVAVHLGCALFPWLLLALTFNTRWSITPIFPGLVACFAAGLAVCQFAHRPRIRAVVVLVDLSFPLFMVVASIDKLL